MPASDMFPDELKLGSATAAGCSPLFLDADDFLSAPGSWPQSSYKSAAPPTLQPPSSPPLKAAAAGTQAPADLSKLSNLPSLQLGLADDAGPQAAPQFLLLNDDELACSDGDGVVTPPQPPASLYCHSAPPQPEAEQGGTASLYCLAVVDEATGLPLRAATPEEAWEVERFFVLAHNESLTQQLQHGQQQKQEQQQEQGQGEQPASAGKSRCSGELVADALPVAAQPHATHDGKRQQPQRQQQQRTSRRASHGGDALPTRTVPPAPTPRAATASPERGASPDVAHKRAHMPRPRTEPRRCGPCDNCGATESPQWRQGPTYKPLLCNACGMRFRRTNQLGLPGDALHAPMHAPRGGAKRAVPQHSPPPQQPQVPPPSPSARARAGGMAAVAPPYDMLLATGKRPRRAAAVAAAAHMAAAMDT